MAGIPSSLVKSSDHPKKIWYLRTFSGVRTLIHARIDMRATANILGNWAMSIIPWTEGSKEAATLRPPSKSLFTIHVLWISCSSGAISGAQTGASSVNSEALVLVLEARRVGRSQPRATPRCIVGVLPGCYGVGVLWLSRECWFSSLQGCSSGFGCPSEQAL